MMTVIAEKRLRNRLTLESSFNVFHKGSPCRVADISPSGLGVTFIGGEDWPENLTLEYSLGSADGRMGLVTCRTVWETSMDFYKARNEEIVRRRGLQFVDPDSSDVEELNRHLKNIAEINN
jgi:hypothetical protein